VTDTVSGLPVFAFVLATLAPYAMAATVCGNGDGHDRRRLEIAVLGTSGLYLVLHLTAFTVGLTLARVLVVMAGVVLVFGVVRLWAGRGRLAGPVVPRLRERWAWMETAATVTAVTVGASWLVSATMSVEVVGTDAAHYHIPHAVNYALGATPWDPLPTRHAYPMGTSLLFAWFMLPFGDAFLVDAAMLIHGALLLAALASLFRSLTGDSGWTWAPWIVFVLCSMPLVVTAGFPSADLPYTAGFMAVSAQLVWMTTAPATRVRDWLVLGCALGLLIASKVTGVYSAVLLGAVAAAVPVTRTVLRRGNAPTVSWHTLWAGAAVACLGLAPGLLWLLRNSLVYGQAVERFSDPYYLSILGDLRTTYQGDWSYLGWRLGRRITQWLGPWFVISGYAILAACLDAAWRIARKRSDAVDRRRLWVTAAAAAVAAVHGAGMIGAPWTSLEHTSGSSLRYVMPVWVTWVTLAGAGLFVRQYPWYQRSWLRTAGWVVTGAGATLLAWTGHGPWLAGFGTAPGTVLAVTLVGLAVAWSGPTAAPATVSLGAAARSLGLLVLAAALASAWLVSRHTPLRQAAADAERQELARSTAGGAADVDDQRRAYLDARRDESLRGAACRVRRFFVASRIDLPLGFQPAVYTSVIFDSRDAGAALALLRRPPGPDACDYVVVLPAEANRPFVTAASAWLTALDATGPLRVYRVTRP
jgi:hypothetical protein